MKLPLPDQAAFARVALALEPYLGDLVIAGAWAHRLFYLHPLAQPPPYAPLMSEDADVATPERLAIHKHPMSDLLKRAGFKEHLEGSDRLPVTSYHLEESDGGLYVEFIAPLRGSGTKRSGAPDNTAVVAGVTATKLRFVDLLLFEPWTLKLTESDGFPIGSKGLSIRIASPTSYLAQKVLTAPRRKKADKRAKDLLYIHDTLTLFGASLVELQPQAGRVLAQLPSKTRTEFHRLRKALCEEQGLLAKAADIARASGRANPPSPSTIAAVCRAGLERVFPLG